MEIVLIILGVLFVFGLIQKLVTSINWGRFFGFIIFGSITLAVLFSFTSEGVIVIVGAYIVLVILAFFYSALKKIQSDN